MNSLFGFIQGLLWPQDTDGAILLWSKEILVALLILAFFWGLSQLCGPFLNRFGKRFTSFTKTDLDDRILQRTIPHVSRLLMMLGLYLAVRSLPLHEKLFVVFSGVLYIVLVVIVFNVVYHFMDELLKWYIGTKQRSGDVLLSRQMILIIEKIVMLLLMAAALVVTLKHFHYDILSLVTALGIGSLAIGLAAKDTLAHMISGFTLMIDSPFQIGDRIKLSNGQIGDVIDIGLRSTKIQGLDATIMVIPNSDLCNSTVINLVRPTAVTQGRINIGVGYDSDVDRVKELLLEIVGENAGVLDNPAPVALFVSFGDCALNMQLLFWVSDPAGVGGVTDQVNCAILRRFREEGIEIPFPIRTINMKKEQQLCPTE